MWSASTLKKKLWVGCLILMLAGFAAAQSDRGTIAGSVLDTTGAAIKDATVTLRGVDTGAAYTTKSTGDGVYRISDVRIGKYDVKVEAPGFKSSLQTGVQIQINTTAALNITLQPGSVNEQVTVLADAPTLQTESSDVGTVVGDKQIHELPLSLNATAQSFVRSPETFIFLTPGVIGQGTNADKGSSGVFETKLSGGQNFGSEILLDGVSVQRLDSGTAFDQTAPSVEALTEFKVTTATPTAQYGHTSGGVESFTTKSGTNGFHGSVFELFRNEALDANPWNLNFDNEKIKQSNVGCEATNSCTALKPKPRDRQNDFGGALGGPVIIPHIYNGRDKTFFFFAWEQYRNRRGLQNSLQTLATDAERNGDFSALLGAPLVDPDTLAPVINPCTGDQVLQGQIFDPSTTQTVGGRTCRLPFPNNQIPNLSGVAQNVLGYVPPTNLAGDSANGVAGLRNNFINTAVLDHVVTTQTSFRIDENLTQKSKLFFTYHSREQNALNGFDFALPAPITPDNYYNYYFTHYLRVGWDYLATPTILNHLTVGFNRVYTTSKSPAVNGTDWPQTLGISGASGETFPTFEFNGGQYSIGYGKLGGSAQTVQIPNALVVADSVSWTRGRHALQVGFDWRSYQFTVEKPGASSPHYYFEGRQTSFTPPAQDPNAANAGDPFASFLLGLPDRETLTVFSHFPRLTQNYYALYVQDDFKMRRNLTLNLGLRWDIETPRHESTGAQAVLSLTATNPLTPGQPGALIYGKSATGADTYFKNFGPRIGFSWSPYARTVVRGGYSIYYAPLGYSDFGDNLGSGTTANPDFQNIDNFTPVQSLDAGFPGFTPPSNEQDPSLNTFTNNTVTYVAPEYGRPGMVQNWQLEVQRELATDLILDIGYVGQHGTRLRSNLAQINSPDPKYNPLGAKLDDLVGSTAGQTTLAQLGVTVPSWFESGWGSQATVGQLLRPFPQYGYITTNCCLENLGQSTYHALQTKLERRFRNGLNLLASYTFSKTITDADSAQSTLTGFNSNNFGAQNPYNLRAEKAVSYQDIPHAFVISYMYELPFGPGKKYLNHGVASKIAGGWQISGVHRYQAGSPAIINAYSTTNPYYGGNWRFSLIPGKSVFPTNPVQWTPSLDATWNSGCFATNGVWGPNDAAAPRPANCDAFVDPSAAGLVSGAGYVFGNLPTAVSWWRSPGYKNEDFSILKRTTIREGQAILFKLDIPNAFNRHTFGGIYAYPGDQYFGVPGGGGHGVINAARQIQATIRYEF
jgi:Carboxypeptidase regulatory-like domain